MIVFVPHVDGDPVHDAVIYLRHVRAGMGFDDQKWHTVSGSSIIGVSDTEHTRWPHLHVEIAVTVDAYLELVSDGTLTRKVVTVDFIGRRAMIRKMNPYDVSTAVNVQMDTDGILLIEEDAIFRQNLPGYKRTEFSYLGRDNVVIVNPEAVIGS